MHKIRQITDAHTVQSYGVLMLSVVPGKELDGAPLAALGYVMLWGYSLLQNKCSVLFLFFTFFHKNENPLQISFGKWKQVGPS